MGTRRQVLGAAAGALFLGGSAAAADPTTGTTTSPAGPLALDRHEYAYARGAGRPLRTVVRLPAAPGRYPLVLFSHGLGGSPERFAQMIGDIAAAGFVVAAPAYPFTSTDAAAVDSGDMPNQPADASAVIGAVLAGPLAARIDAARVGAAGHSAGGFTTAGLLAARSRDRRVRTAVVLAGGAMNGAFTGPATGVLFAQGDRDPVVPYATGRAAYRAVPWPKLFLTLPGADHESWMFDRGPASVVVTRTVLDFLRWGLYGDARARLRLPPFQ